MHDGTGAWHAHVWSALRNARQRWWLQPGWRSVVLALALALAISTTLMFAGWLERQQTAWHDFETRLFAPRGMSPGVLLVDIDGPSLEALRPQLGGWPPRRDLLALAADYLMDAGARAVAIDIVFADSREGDEAMVRMLVARRGRVVLAAGALSTPSGPPEPGPGGCPVLPWTSLLLPTPVLSGAAEAQPIGMISMPSDGDGQLRALPLLHAGPGQLLPLLPMAALLAAHGADASTLRCVDGYALLDGLRLPIDAKGRVWPAFSRRADSVALQSFLSVAQAAMGALDDTSQRNLVRGRVVFIGATAALGDQVQTPLGPRSGANLLAATFSALETGLLYRPPRPPLELALLLLSCVPALAAWRRGALRWPPDLAWTGAMLVVLVAIDGATLTLLLQRTRIVWPALTLLTFALLSQLHRRHVMVELQRRLELERQAADAASQLKSEFLAHMSHEIRTPMNALLGSANLLAQTPLDERQRHYVNLFQSAGAELMDMLNDLLDLSKIEAGLFELHPQPFSLVEFLACQSMLFESSASQKGLRLLTQIAPDLPAVVLGDAHRLAQVLRNLLSNALKFTLQGSVTLSAMRVAGTEDCLRFEVRDTGIGIAANRLEKIFLPFTQADSAIDHTYGGTGLGLTISRRLVTLMGGSVGVESRAGEGSVFHVELKLPASHEPPVADWAQSARVTQRGPQPALNILLADDSPHNVLLVQAYLEQDGHRIDVVHDGLAAVERFGQRRYDLVLMDVQMPGMDGYRATAALRAIERSRGDPATPVIALTANALPDDERRSQAAGCTAHLSKPFSRAQLRHIIERYSPQPDVPAVREGVAPFSGPNETPIPAAWLTQLGVELAPALERMGGQTEFYLRVLRVAGPAMQSWSARFAAALAQDDLAQANRLAHDLKSVAVTIGAMPLSCAAQALESELRSAIDAGEGAAADWMPLLAAVEAALAPLLVALGAPAEHVDPDGGN